MKTSFPQTWKQRRLDDLDIPRASPQRWKFSFPILFLLLTGKEILTPHAKEEEEEKEDKELLFF